MQPSEENRPTKMLLFIGVGVVLLGITVFGVVFAKYRADLYVNKGSEQVAQQNTPPTDQAAPPSQPAENNATSNVAGSETTTTSSSPTVSMPAAGAADTFMITLGLAASAFFVTKIMLRRRVN